MKEKLRFTQKLRDILGKIEKFAEFEIVLILDY